MNMKNYIIILAAIAATLPALAQKIETDKIDADGTRTIMGSLERCRDFTDRQVLYFGLMSVATATDTTYCLALQIKDFDPLHIKKDSRLLVKTFKGENFELLNDVDVECSVPTPNQVTGTYYVNEYIVTAMYRVTPAVLEAIARDGVKKIRIEGELKQYDKEYKKDKAGKVLATEYNLIRAKLAKKADFHDDF